MGPKGLGFFAKETQTAAIQTTRILVLTLLGLISNTESNTLLPQIFRFSVYPALLCLL